MTRSPWTVLGVVVGFVALGASARAQQAVDAPVLPRGVATLAPGVVLGPIVGETFVGAGAPAVGSQTVLPYSYYVTFPEPARVYVGYGPNDGFPFRGQPYGHAGDRWSWSAMSTGNGSLARYYYQILR